VMSKSKSPTKVIKRESQEECYLIAERKPNYVEMMKHFFTEHLLKSDHSSDFRMQMAHIYFVFTVQRNHYLANFLMLNFLT
jgi:hypothetical protein